MKVRIYQIVPEEETLEDVYKRQAKRSTNVFAANAGMKNLLTIHGTKEK